MKRINANRFLLAMRAVAVSASFATAQENLLAGAIGTTVNSPEAFYNVWQVFDKDGRPVEDGFRKFSCFTQARVSESSKAAVYDDDPDHNIYGDHEAFSDGNYFIFMKFPDKSHVNAPHYYCYPINIKEEGDFLLTGCGQGHDKVTAGVPDEHNLLHQLENIAITFDKKVTPKEFRIENNANGEPEVVAYAGTEKVPVYRSKVGGSATSLGGNFSHTVHLTPEHKYMTIHGPAELVALGNLALMPATAVIVNEILPDGSSQSIYFDLQGRHAGSDSGQLEKGIYIRKTGAKTEKIVIR